ncbi:MAG: DinB family protein [Bacteroidota bacterium]
MQFNLAKSIEILERTPFVLTQLLSGLSEDWTHSNEGTDTWSPFDVLGHLVHGELTDWIPRTKIILEHGPSQPFEPFDRFAQNKTNKGKTLQSLLEEFTRLRKENLRILKNFQLDGSALARKSTHPELGEVRLDQLLATWTAHDLGHLVQISRVMAKQYKGAVGPWEAYLTVVNE